jgi:hypothetical protein
MNPAPRNGTGFFLGHRGPQANSAAGGAELLIGLAAVCCVRVAHADKEVL